MEGKSVVSGTLPKVPVNGPHTMLGPYCVVARVVYRYRILQMYTNSSNSVIIETILSSAWRNPGRKSVAFWHDGVLSDLRFIFAPRTGTARNCDNICQAYAPENQHGRIWPDRGVSCPAMCGGGTVAVVSELLLSYLGWYICAMTKFWYHHRFFSRYVAMKQLIIWG